MVPSTIITLDRFPLMSNGKVDRRALPPPESLTSIESQTEHTKPATRMEERVHELWCKVLHLKQIPIKKSFFFLHGTSLAFMKLYSLYQIEFGMAPDIVDCFRHASISEHAERLTELVSSTAGERYQAWSHLHVNCAEVSFAQSRIFLDEQIRFHSSNQNNISIYSLPLLYRLSEGSLSVQRLQQALRQITRKHAILRTSIQLDKVEENLTQCVQLNNAQDWFFYSTSIIDDDGMLENIFTNEMTDRTYFDVSAGQVARCHIVRRRSTVVIENDDFLSVGDWIIFNFHHIAFDGQSEQIFFDDLHQFYTQTHDLKFDDQEITLQYIDCKLN
ncbi:unnamed protein product [Rotaria sp. Silwood1]|nr:unnamed protein product [Rotaria sp. Silwood1]